ncbi:MAG TPA: hypothetical protein VGJ55_20070 [Pyrinomonadaceae bacterium]|jgi:hypothetical protein
MRKAFWIFGLVSVFTLVALGASAVKPANFAGTWNLDKDKSQGLDQRMQNASVTWTITQDEKQISIDSKVTAPPAGAPPAGAPAAGGPGGGYGAGRGMGGPRVYSLDGKEVTTEAGGQMGGSNTTKATWANDGNTLELSAVRTGTGRDGTEFKSTSTDKLSLSGDGKVLTVTRHSEGPRGSQDSTLVFNKQ